MLEGLGIGPAEEELYRLLLARPGIPVTELSRATARPISSVESDLASLERMGLVSRAPGKGSAPVLVTPAAAIDLLALQRRRQVATALAAAQQLLSDAHPTQAGPPEAVEVISGWPAVQQRYLQLEHSAEADFMSFDKPPYKTAVLGPNAAEDERLGTGVRFRALYERAALEYPGQSAQLTAAISAGEEARAARRLPMKLVIADRRLALIPQRLDEPGLEAALVVHRSPLLDALVELFELHWERSTTITIDRGRIVLADQPPPGALSDADARLLMLLAGGLTDAAVGRQLGISQRTVQRKVNTLMDRLGVDGRFQLGAEATARGWLTRGPAVAEPGTHPGRGEG